MTTYQEMAGNEWLYVAFAQQPMREQKLIIKLNSERIMKTHDDLRWDFKQETELDSVYRQNNNCRPFNEAYVKWLEDKILLANDVDTGQDKCHIQRISNSEAAVCPKCASKDVIWTVYCNNCNEAM